MPEARVAAYAPEELVRQVLRAERLKILNYPSLSKVVEKVLLALPAFHALAEISPQKAALHLLIDPHALLGADAEKPLILVADKSGIGRYDAHRGQKHLRFVPAIADWIATHEAAVKLTAIQLAEESEALIRIFCTGHQLKFNISSFGTFSNHAIAPHAHLLLEDHHLAKLKTAQSGCLCLLSKDGVILLPAIKEDKLTILPYKAQVSSTLLEELKSASNYFSRATRREDRGDDTELALKTRLMPNIIAQEIELGVYEAARQRDDLIGVEFGLFRSYGIRTSFIAGAKGDVHSTFSREGLFAATEILNGWSETITRSFEHLRYFSGLPKKALADMNLPLGRPSHIPISGTSALTYLENTLRERMYKLSFGDIEQRSGAHKILRTLYISDVELSALKENPDKAAEYIFMHNALNIFFGEIDHPAVMQVLAGSHQLKEAAEKAAELSGGNQIFILQNLVGIAFAKSLWKAQVELNADGNVKSHWAQRAHALLKEIQRTPLQLELGSF
jgi:hypothetical protein